MNGIATRPTAPFTHSARATLRWAASCRTIMSAAPASACAGTVSHHGAYSARSAAAAPIHTAIDATPRATVRQSIERELRTQELAAALETFRDRHSVDLALGRLDDLVGELLDLRLVHAARLVGA